MKKKRFWLFVALLLVGFMGMHSQKVEAAPWGAKKLYTTPVAARGTWYYKESGKINRFKITKHTVWGKKLYYMLPKKEYNKLESKLESLPEKKYISTIYHLDDTICQVYEFKWHGIKSFNVNGWLAGAGDGAYYVPVTKLRHGKKVQALRIGHGAYNWLTFYAYKSPELVK